MTQNPAHGGATRRFKTNSGEECGPACGATTLRSLTPKGGPSSRVRRIEVRSTDASRSSHGPSATVDAIAHSAAGFVTIAGHAAAAPLEHDHHLPASSFAQPTACRASTRSRSAGDLDHRRASPDARSHEGAIRHKGGLRRPPRGPPSTLRYPPAALAIHARKTTLGPSGLASEDTPSHEGRHASSHAAPTAPASSFWSAPHLRQRGLARVWIPAEPPHFGSHRALSPRMHHLRVPFLSLDDGPRGYSSPPCLQSLRRAPRIRRVHPRP